MLGIMKTSDKHEIPFDTFDRLRQESGVLRQEGGVLCYAMRAGEAQGLQMLREGGITDKTDLRDRQ